MNLEFRGTDESSINSEITTETRRKESLSDHMEIYFIKAAELELLLAAAGMESWYGMPVAGPAADIKKEDIHALLAGLYQKGYISWESGTLPSREIILQEPAATMVRILRDATECLKLEYEEEVPVLMVYMEGDRCLYLEESPLDKKTFRFRTRTKKETDCFMQEHSWQIKSVERTRLSD